MERRKVSSRAKGGRGRSHRYGPDTDSDTCSNRDVGEDIKVLRTEDLGTEWLLSQFLLRGVPPTLPSSCRSPGVGRDGSDTVPE